MKLVVLGGGESGVGTAILGKKQGYEVFVSDFGKIQPKYKNVLTKYDISWEENTHSESKILSADVIMKSPGIPDTAIIVKKAHNKKIKIQSEIEFASQFTNATTIGITGSNGKTTTTLLTYHLLKQAGLNVGIAGNIGKSFAWQIAECNYDFYVLELSSFQLDGISKYKPHIAIITNLSPDHLDRYDNDYKKYINSKFRITKNQTQSNYLIVDANDVEVNKWLKNNTTQAKVIRFSIQNKKNSDIYIQNNKMIDKIEDTEIALDTFTLQGKHNVKNAMAATATAKLLQVRKQAIRESLGNFQGVPHRLEKVAKKENVLYINDSKATNVNAVFYALDSVISPVIWIVGGVDKGNDYDELMSLVREKVKGIICLGIHNNKLITAFEDVVETIIETTSVTEAVKIAQKMSTNGDTVLLSPACASFDLFKNYEDRGNQFKKAVTAL